MNRIQPIAAHVAYMTCPGNHGMLLPMTTNMVTTFVVLQRSHISSATTLTGSPCLQMTIHSGIHGIWAQYISSGIPVWNSSEIEVYMHCNIVRITINRVAIYHLF